MPKKGETPQGDTLMGKGRAQERRNMLHGGDIYSVFEKDPEAEKKLVDFSANISPLGMPEAVRQAVTAGLDRAVHYPDPKCRTLKDSICRFYMEKRGIFLSRDMIMCGNGAADVIYRFVLAMNPKKALLLAPTFAEYEEALKLTKTSLEFYFCPKDTLAVQEDILEKIHKGLDVMFLCNPNNPTGLLTDPGLLKKIIEKTGRNGVFLVVDECFLDFSLEEDRYSVISDLSQNEHILVLKSFTKMYGMAGIRLGYGVCRDRDLVEKMEHQGQTWPVSTLASEAGMAALLDINYPEKVRQYVLREREYLFHALSRLGIRFWHSHANYILFQLSDPADFYDRMLKKGFLIRRCANYRGLDETFYRMAVNKHEDNMGFINALEDIIREVSV